MLDTGHIIMYIQLPRKFDGQEAHTRDTWLPSIERSSHQFEIKAHRWRAGGGGGAGSGWDSPLGS
jgi:hypothetical protein